MTDFTKESKPRNKWGQFIFWLWIVSVAVLVVTQLIKAQTMPCYSSTYILDSQELKSTVLCENCLYIQASSLGSGTPETFYFENDHRLLNAQQGSIIEMKWCPTEQGYFVRGVKVKRK